MTLTDQLLRDEGLRLKPYKDTVGKLTIGVGRNLDDKGISRSEALFLLENDITETENRLTAAMPWATQLIEARRGVLVNMAFNMGMHGLLAFKRTLLAVQLGRYDKAAEYMLTSKWATQVGERAQRLSVQMRTGEWQ